MGQLMSRVITNDVYQPNRQGLVEEFVNQQMFWKASRTRRGRPGRRARVLVCRQTLCQ